ncbi:hypothetical protein [Mycobacterium sp. GA-1285]|nr:hypothetical protein [Mycobacterium sp. GA-1285]
MAWGATEESGESLCFCTGTFKGADLDVAGTQTSLISEHMRGATLL